MLTRPNQLTPLNNNYNLSRNFSDKHKPITKIYNQIPKKTPKKKSIIPYHYHYNGIQNYWMIYITVIKFVNKRIIDKSLVLQPL